MAVVTPPMSKLGAHCRAVPLELEVRYYAKMAKATNFSNVSCTENYEHALLKVKGTIPGE
jgi:hypothetical protein